MGRIVKAASLAPSSKPAQYRRRADGYAGRGVSGQENAAGGAPTAGDREAALADVTELLVSARAAAETEWAAAKDAALVLARKMAEKIIGRAVEARSIRPGRDRGASPGGKPGARRLGPVARSPR